ncbi:protein phosphatase 1 regulatory subunit 1C-like isoform X4 [Nerophis ophidion]|uniref:protein phosphatase 1 regulatory subunit 1C-like isoform X4 n=1 Tax=Nerophis ophidion TaxID=159077 RepID=UPI002ADFDDD7|nr:protein phosphatase 1 regulatory subunit 1C-like isoform X4 [Nerophis ophidion]
MEPSSPKKIQFVVPPLQGHLDPQASEQIRRRRPTPATLQIYRQPEAGDQYDASGGAQTSDGAQRKHSTWAPPTRKALQSGVEPNSCQFRPMTAQLLWTNQNEPQEDNGNEAGLLLSNQEREMEASSSSGVSPDSPGVSHDSPGVSPDSPGVSHDSPGVSPDSPGVSPDSQIQASSPDSVSR